MLSNVSQIPSPALPPLLLGFQGPHVKFLQGLPEDFLAWLELWGRHLCSVVEKGLLAL